MMKQLLRRQRSIPDFVRFSGITNNRIESISRRASYTMGCKPKTKLPSADTPLRPMQKDCIASQLYKRQQQKSTMIVELGRPLYEVQPGDIDSETAAWTQMGASRTRSDGIP